ncbi:MAG TPA: transglycosylase SLT domain-containing protein [Gemmatimonadaceae bacterium]|nr:transglycosylase SLT domain-containing protein [Gemmatimonadaceae bacterium]
MRVLLGLIVFAGIVGAQDPAPQTAPQKLSALDRAAADRNARHDKTRYDAFFKKYSKRYFGINFDWQYFKAQGLAESELNAAARSYVGARGVMQLMPSTFQEIQTKRPEFQSIDDPEWNIAAGIMHDRYLWKLWEPVGADSDRTRFMFGSYNAGEGTIGRATAAAHAKQLDEMRWPNIELVAPEVPRWRYRETIGYVKKIATYYGAMRAPR